MFKKLMARVDRALDLFERLVEAQEKVVHELNFVNRNLIPGNLWLDDDGPPRETFYDLMASKLSDINERLLAKNKSFIQAFLYRDENQRNKSAVIGIFDELRPRSLRPGSGYTPLNAGNHLARIAKSLELATNSEQIEKALKQNAEDLRGLADKLGVPDANSRRR